MLPNYRNPTNFSDQTLYSLQERSVPPLLAQTTLTSETPQLKQVTRPVVAAETSTYQQRKRTCRADRHSKIRTAQGERDRRMRLSVQVANQFFTLQDHLGFDKASKTIDWLLTQAKDSIDQLSSSSFSQPPKVETPTDQLPQSDSEPVHEMAVEQKANKEAECQLKARELRGKARARAREEKVVSCKLDQLVPAGAASTGRALMDGDCNGMEYYYFLLNEIDSEWWYLQRGD